MSRDGDEEGCNYWLKLPRDITVLILQKVGVFQMLMSAQLVCTQWRNICTDPSTWSTISLLDVSFDNYTRDVQDMIRWAVNLSRGTLFDLNLSYFISEQLLDYVVKRCTKITRLRGVPHKFIEHDLIERVAKRLAHLEELELVGEYGYLPLDAIDTLRRYCPKLRLESLKIVVYSLEDAKAVAKRMPQLRYIYLSAKTFTYVDLEALLDGYSHLESLLLDIRQPYSSNIIGTFQLTKKKKNKLPSTCFNWGVELSMHTWRLHYDDFDLEQLEHVKDVIRWAVNKSCGGMVDVNLDQFMSDQDLFSYVVERCTQITRLRGCVMSLDCAEKVLRIAAPRLPLLENLQLVYGSTTLLTESIGNLLRCFPRLTSLEISIYNDEEAKILARNLPQLRHFKPINAYNLNDMGVEALLDGCPNLESLDLEDCNHVKLNGTLEIRCAQQIKYLQRPKYFYCCCYSCCDSIEDQTTYEYDILIEQEEEEEVKRRKEEEAEEEEIVYVNYTICSRQEYWSRRRKVRAIHIGQLRKEKCQKKKFNTNTGRDQKAKRRRREFKTADLKRRQVKKEFIHLNKMATNPYSLYNILA